MQISVAPWFIVFFLWKKI